MSEFTVGEAAAKLNCPEHRIQYLFRSRKVTGVRKIAGRRVLTQEQFEQIARMIRGDEDADAIRPSSSPSGRSG